MQGFSATCVLTGLMALSVAACGPSAGSVDAPPEAFDLSLPELLESLEGEFTPVGDVTAPVFPADHAAHPAYRTEGWVLSGIVGGGSNRISALQVTIFRIGLGEEPELDSDWATGDVYAAVTMLADASTDGVRVDQRVSRAGAGLAGSSRDPLSIWVEDWRLDLSDPQPGRFSLDGNVTLGDLDVEFETASEAAVVMPGDPAGGDNAQSSPFAYYAQPMLEGTATIGAPGNDGPVTADFVFEHAWGELPLPGSPVARDRFALFLEDGSELTLVRTHRADGSGTPATQGLFVDADGSVRPLGREAVELEASRYWQSPGTDARYPIGWRLRIAELDIDAELRPARRDHEAVVWAPLWMGPVDLVSSSRPLGQGMMVLNGYGSESN